MLVKSSVITSLESQPFDHDRPIQIPTQYIFVEEKEKEKEKDIDCATPSK